MGIETNEVHSDLSEESFQKLLTKSSMPVTDRVGTSNLSELFRPIEDKQNIYATFTETFERYKVRVDLFKWLIGTIGITLVTFIINWGFRDRAQGLEELEMYDRYATATVVLAENPKNRLLLSQFYSSVTPSEKLREGWQSYLTIVEKEVRMFDLKRKILDDSLAKLAIDTSKSTEKRQIYDDLKVRTVELDRINDLLLVNEKIPIVSIPSYQNKNNNAEQAELYERQGFEQLIAKDVLQSIDFFRRSENVFNGYHNVYDIANYLQANRELLSQNDSNNWIKIYRQILKQYSWSMPQDIKAQLISESK